MYAGRNATLSRRGFSLYRAVSHGRSLGSYVTGILSVMTLLLVVLNVRAVIITDVLFPTVGYGGFGPLFAHGSLPVAPRSKTCQTSAAN